MGGTCEYCARIDQIAAKVGYTAGVAVSETPRLKLFCSRQPPPVKTIAYGRKDGDYIGKCDFDPTLKRGIL